MDRSNQENPPAEDSNSITENPQVEEGTNSKDQYWNYEDQLDKELTRMLGSIQRI